MSINRGPAAAAAEQAGLLSFVLATQVRLQLVIRRAPLGRLALRLERVQAARQEERLGRDPARLY